MRYCFVILAFIVLNCLGNNALIDKAVVVRVTAAENAVSAKRRAIRDAYIKVADEMLSDKGLSVNDVSNALNQELNDDKILEIFSKFIESFSISDEKIAFNDYQAKFNFKILDENFNAWAFSIVSKIMQKSNANDIPISQINDIYSKEISNDLGDRFANNDDVVVELKNDNTQVAQNDYANNNINNVNNENNSTEVDVNVVCYFQSSFTEWMYFYKDRVDRVLNNYKIINFDDKRIKLNIHAARDDFARFSSMFDKEGIKFFDKGNNIWVIEQKI